MMTLKKMMMKTMTTVTEKGTEVMGIKVVIAARSRIGRMLGRPLERRRG